jgi:hypothetical protein
MCCRLLILVIKLNLKCVEQSKARVCSRLLAGIAGSNTTGGIDV